MAATLTDPLLGQLIDGRYEVLSRIARGGMATVYLANDRRLDREVAVKVMHQHLAEGASGADFVARFRREARAAARLTHPGLVGVLDQGVDGDVSYLIMEYVDGPTLRRHLDERGSLTVGEALQITEAVLDALSAAHRTGLVHRDIKPENVLLDADDRVRITDFGLARAVTEVTSTTTGTVLGTVGYLAPELVTHGVCDPRTDVYAAGILLYEMLTGAQPFTGATPIQVAYQHVNQDVPAVSDAIGWLPVEIDELVGALAARDPQDRPLDAVAALAHLRRVQRDLDPELLARRADVAPRVPADQASDPEAVDGADGPASGPGTAHPSGVDLRHDATVALADLGSVVETGPDGLPLSRTVALRIGTGLEPADAEPIEDAPRRSRRWVPLLAWIVSLALLGAGVAAAWNWYVTDGPGAFTSVPGNLVGVSLAQAEATLDAADLAHTATEAFDPEIGAGIVLSATPGEGDSIRKDGEVDLVVSKGPDLREVPAVPAGTPLADAVGTLEAAGFVVPTPERAFDDAVPADHVLTVSAEPGTLLPVDTEVLLTVSDGPKPETVVSVVGLTLDQARADLEGLGFVVTEQQDYSERYEEGRVIAQSPEGGTAGHRRDQVTLTVSLGMPYVEVPDVRQKELGEARQILEDAGFKVTYSQAWFWDTMVVKQTPEAGEQARKGSTVDLRLN